MAWYNQPTDTWVYAGAALALVLILTSIVAICCCRRRRNAQAEEPSAAPRATADSERYFPSNTMPVHSRNPGFDQFGIARSDLTATGDGVHHYETNRLREIGFPEDEASPESALPPRNQSWGESSTGIADYE